MAQRQIAQREETSVYLPDDHKEDMWKAGANLAGGLIGIKQKQDEANMNNFAATAQLDMMKKTNDWRIANEGNPMDQKSVDTLHQEYDNTLNQYDEKVGFLSRGAWTQVKDKIKNTYKAQNNDWGVKQSFKNAETSINTSIKTNLSMASEYGRKGDINAAMAHFTDAQAGLDIFANGVLGTETRSKLTADFKADYMKSFLVGQAEQNPDATLKMLEDEKIRDGIGDVKDVQLLKSFAQKQKKAIERASVEVRDASVNRDYLEIPKGTMSFEKIDESVARGEYGVREAEFLKKVMVQAVPKNDDKQVVARYVSMLSSLPIDSDEEAQKIREDIYADPKLTPDTKETLLFDTPISKGNEEPFSLGDTEFGKKVPTRKWFWGWFQNVNKTDAVDAYLKFKKNIQGDETPTMLRRKANRAISDVAIERNSNIAELGQDWTGMVDGNGVEFMARMNEDGEIETQMPSMSSDQSNDTNNDEDADNGD